VCTATVQCVECVMHSCDCTDTCETSSSHAGSSSTYAYFVREASTFDTTFGPSVGMYFHNINQSDPLEQRRMLSAWREALQDPLVDNKTSLPYNWLLAFTAYVTTNSPESLGEDG
jgi:hypothetical protein